MTEWLKQVAEPTDTGPTATTCGVDGPEGYQGTRALIHAASGGSTECVKLLLDAGADVRLSGANNSTALHYATYKLHRSIAELICTHPSSAPHLPVVMAVRGSSELWSSLGAATVHELARFNMAQATEFHSMLVSNGSCDADGGGAAEGGSSLV